MPFGGVALQEEEQLVAVLDEGLLLLLHHLILRKAEHLLEGHHLVGEVEEGQVVQGRATTITTTTTISDLQCFKLLPD